MLNSLALIFYGKELIAEAILKGNLYELKIQIDGKAAANSCDAQNDKQLWHRRMGHIGRQGISILSKNGFIKNMNSNSTSDLSCEVCLSAKQCRGPFSDTRPRAKRVLERVHSDVCGSLAPTAWDGSKYYISFIADFSHFAAIYPIKKKSDVFDSFKQYEAECTAKFGARISMLTTDQGTEYLSTKQREWYKEKGIQIQTTIAYSPQQNGVAERFNRTLCEKVRAMLFESGVPKRLWNEAALTAVYLINRSPTKAISKNKTPAEIWYGFRPDF